MSKSTVAAKARTIGSREAVEDAIEKSKDGRAASWERPVQTGPLIPKWGSVERPTSAEDRKP